MYYFLRSFMDPAPFILLVMASGLWFLRDARQEKKKRIGWCVLMVCFIILYSLSCPVVVRGLAYMIEKNFVNRNPAKADGIDVIVVLGSGVASWGDVLKVGPSGETATRFLYGLEMLKVLDVKNIIFSGSVNEVRSEAKIMAGLAKQLGFDDSNIIVEARSRNTWEHGFELDRLIKDKSLTIGVVTSAVHMKRSLVVMRKYFPNVVALSSSYIYKPAKISFKLLMPSARYFSVSTTILHEVIGLIWYGIRN